MHSNELPTCPDCGEVLDSFGKALAHNHAHYHVRRMKEMEDAL
jgi:hypothetical protein